MRRVILAGLAGAALCFGTPQTGTAQENQWRITPFVGGAIFAGPTEFENTFALGASLMRRLGRWGVEAQTYLTPTSLGETTEGLTTPDGDFKQGYSEVADPKCREGDSTLTPEEIYDLCGLAELSSTFGASQKMLFNSVSLVLFSTAWQPNRPPPRTEWFAVGGLGLAMFMTDHPANQGGSVDVWSAGTTKLLLNVGGGVQFNLNRRTSIQLELRETAFKHLERWEGVDKWHNNITLRQGITLIR